jgi:electron transfer flavoprotein alpha subunit
VVADAQMCGPAGGAEKLVATGRRLADRLGVALTAVLIGGRVAGQASNLLAHGADRVLLFEDTRHKEYHPQLHAAVLTSLVEDQQPQILLLPDSRVGMDLAPTVAARLGTGLSAHCIDLDIDEGGRLVQMVPAFGLGCVATILCPEHRPQMATVKLGALDEARASDRDRDGEIVRAEADLPVDTLGITLLEALDKPAPAGCPLEEADVVVAGGAGIGSAEGWSLIEGLADRLGAAVGATRPAVDEGWAAEDQMIGHSGRTVRPTLYFAIGISGDALHVVGMKDSQVVVAINSDPQAPIFRQADYGLVGDYREIVPLLAPTNGEGRGAV